MQIFEIVDKMSLKTTTQWESFVKHKVENVKWKSENLQTQTTAWNKNDTKIQALLTIIKICNLLVIIGSKVAFDEKNQFHDISKMVYYVI
jgi:hypothetical protein